MLRSSWYSKHKIVNRKGLPPYRETPRLKNLMAFLCIEAGRFYMLLSCLIQQKLTHSIITQIKSSGSQPVIASLKLQKSLF